MTDKELITESLSRLAERVYRLEREKETNTEAFRDGRRRVIACRVLDAVDREIFGAGSGCGARTRAVLEKAVRDILEEHNA